MDQYIGRLLDNRYEILEIIGTGGMAVVYKARCHRLNRLVAIKILKDEFSRDEEFRRRFHAEGEAVAMLSHPNIVQVFDVSSSDNANFIVMELVDGISMKQYMERKGVLNWKETLHFSMQIAKGLEHAHSRGIVHRDIKPHNVMVLKNGSVKVMDFGIARVMSKSNTLTKEALGSVHYISPEQAKGGYTDNRSDLYSLSVVMYEMMTGRPPYDGESPVAVAIQHINGGAAMPTTLNPNIPTGLEQIIMKGMSLEPNDRYNSATEMLRDMDEFRKDPNIQFGYWRSPVSDATQSVNLGNLTRKPRTTAERVAQNKTGNGVRTGNTGRVRNSDTGRQRTRDTGNFRDSGRLRDSGTMVVNTGKFSEEARARTAVANRREADWELRQRKRRQELEEEEHRSRITTIAIVACSFVAVIAIIIFLVALFSGALFNQRTEMVTVPKLVGEMYSELGIYEDFRITTGQAEYHDTYEKGVIIHQEPSPGSKIQVGGEVTVIVSRGPENTIKYMEELRGKELEDVMAFLEREGMNPISYKEFSSEYQEGQVIRTNPTAGSELTKGQKIEVYYSAGPVIKTAKMPNLVGLDYATAMKRLDDLGFDNVDTLREASDEPKDEVIKQSIAKDTETDLTEKIILTISKGPTTKKARVPNVEGMSYKDAVKRLNDYGFTNVDPEYIEDEAPKDQVIGQSVSEGMELDVKTNIVLTVSKGPAETKPTEPEPVTKQVDIPLPEAEEPYILGLYLNGQPVRESLQIQPGTTQLTVELTGIGKQTYTLYMNGEPMAEPEGTFEVDFGANG